MLIVYKRVSEAQIQKDAAKMKIDIADWFEANPKRRTCNAQVWYGKAAKIRRAYIEADVDAAAANAKKD